VISSALCAQTASPPEQNTVKISNIPNIKLGTVEADGIKIFCREAGPADAPVILLLHGYPTSSHMFRHLIPRLASSFRVIAPDLPGCGFTEVPSERQYRYTFDSLAVTVNAFVEALNLKRYAIYVFDYGAPTGFRLAVAHPERVTAIISQNGKRLCGRLGRRLGPD
jgi:pimeloyl-ACP methyl ester carboxylesterase